MHFLVKLFPEITIKSKPVRKRFARQLQDNLRDLLRRIDNRIVVQRDWEKIEITAPLENREMLMRVTDVLACTPGIANFAQVESYPLGDMDDVFKKTQAVWGEALAGKTFCVRAKRSGSHNFTSVELERYVGGGLNQHTRAAGVRLKDPDVTVRLEIRGNRLFIIRNINTGLGGFPLGTQDSVLSLISGGFDSTVSSYLTLKRGLLTHYCFFRLGGRAHEVGVKEVAFYLWNRFGASHGVKFITIPFEDVVAEIVQNVENSQMGVILKRMMLRAATRVAQDMGIRALVTGESVAQVSSQTLANLCIIDGVTDTLVLRPLITMDKGDIIDLSRKIGTEVFAAHMPEYCGVISVKPTTRARVERVEKEEGNFDFGKLEAAIVNRQTTDIDGVVGDLGGDGKAARVSVARVSVVTVSKVPANTVIVDIRHPEEEDLKPLLVSEIVTSDTDCTGIAICKIPFYTLNTVFPTLCTDTQYLLYCEKGVMSQLHALHLKEAGFNNVGVYRPEKNGGERAKKQGGYLC